MQAEKNSWLEGPPRGAVAATTQCPVKLPVSHASCADDTGYVECRQADPMKDPSKLIHCLFD